MTQLSILLLFLLLLQTFLILTLANFNVNAMAGSVYRQKIGDGSATCPDLILFSQNGVEHPASTVTLDRVPCSGGTLQLATNPQQTSIAPGLIRYFEVNRVVGNTYFGGVFSSDVICGSRSITPQIYMLFFRPIVTFTITWEDVIGIGRPLELNSASVYTFRKNTDYMVINNRCLYIRDQEDDGSKCFPADATVEVKNKGIVPIKEVQRGDLVKVVNGKYSPIFAFTHHDSNVIYKRFVTVRSDGGHVFTATEGHFVKVNRQFLPLETIKVGDQMIDSKNQLVNITSILHGVSGTGLYNPQTLDGTIIVNGLVASTYTTAVDYITAHALLTPMRAVFKHVSLNWMRKLPFIASSILAYK